MQAQVTNFLATLIGGAARTTADGEVSFFERLGLLNIIGTIEGVFTDIDNTLAELDNIDADDDKTTAFVQAFFDHDAVPVDMPEDDETLAELKVVLITIAHTTLLGVKVLQNLIEASDNEAAPSDEEEVEAEPESNTDTPVDAPN